MALDVRPAQADDVPAIVLLAYWMTSESPRFRRHGFSTVKARALVERLVELGGLFVAAEGKELIGFFAGVMNEHFLSEVKVAAEIGVYVLPSRRGTSAFPRLVRAFESWAKNNGAQEIAVGISTGVEPERTVCMYERLGYTIASQGLIKAGV